MKSLVLLAPAAKEPGFGILQWVALPLRLLVCMSLAGCGNGLARVSGTVTLDGNPMVGDRDHRITVMFVPESGTGTTTAALVDEDGRYELATGSQAGLQPGNYLVGINAIDVLRSADASAPPSARRVSPKHYADPTRSGFRAEVQLGSNTFDFDLRSDAKG